MKKIKPHSQVASEAILGIVKSFRFNSKNYIPKEGVSFSLFRIESRDLIIIATNGNMNETWAIIILDKDKGQIWKLGQLIKLKNTNIETPRHISGITIGKIRAKS